MQGDLSWSGLLTLVILILCGPAVYKLRDVHRNRSSSSSTHDDANANKTEEADEDTTNTLTISNLSIDHRAHDDRHAFHSMEYIFALLGYAIGIANIWRFPYIIAQNGGGACLIAYVLCAIFVAVPLFLYEMLVGQHVRVSTIRCYTTIRPRWKSLGIASSIMSLIVLSYYGMMVGYTFPYIIHSLETPLPWIEQGAESFWNDFVLRNGSISSNGDGNSDGEIDDGLGPIQWNLASSLIVFWVIAFLSVAYGKEVLAKITYVTVILPIVLLVILVVRTLFLDGAMDGIAFYIVKFEYDKLLDVRVWATACSQILFSLSPGFGTALTYSSFAKPKEDVYKACMIVAIANSTFSIFGGFAVFGLVGHLAKIQNVAVEDIATRSGLGLAFITIAEAMQYFGPLANCMSVLFFFMLFTLGLNSVYAWLETISGYIHDYLQEHGYSKKPVWLVSGSLVTILMSMGLVFTTRMGNAVLDIVDHYVGSLFLLFIVFVESIMLNVDFGWKRLEYCLLKATYGNPETPKGRTLFPKWLCRFDLHVTVPLVSGLLGVYLLVADTTQGYGNHSPSLNITGWVFLGTLIAIACSTLYKKEPGTLKPFNIDEVPHEERQTMAKFDPNVVQAPTIAVTPTSEAGSTELSGAV